MQCTMVICEFLPKTAYPIVFTEEGIVISEISVSKNAWSPIDATPFSIVTEESAWQTERRTYGVRTLRKTMFIRTIWKVNTLLVRQKA